jgi:hypothetical protein
LQRAAVSFPESAAIDIGCDIRSVWNSKGCRVAILLRGQTFRGGKDEEGHNMQSCQQSAYEGQMKATKSLSQMIVTPLESQGHEVNIFFTDARCNLTEQLHPLWASSQRSVAGGTVNSTSQSHNVRLTLEMFKKSVDADAIAATYDLILMTRHDVVWMFPFNRWPVTDHSKFYFTAWCGPKVRQAFGSNCTHDIMHMMPGSLFSSFDQEVGRTSCFPKDAHNAKIQIQKPRASDKFVDNGHRCYDQVDYAMKRKDSGTRVAFEKWRPNGVEESHELNSWAYIL